MSQNFILIFDADNTIWDTNSVFLEAQLAMLKPFEEHGYIFDVKEEILCLRKIDQLVANKLENFEYDFGLLSKALTSYYKYKTTLEDAVNNAVNQHDSRVEHISEASYKNYTDYINKIPSLLDGVGEFFLKFKPQIGVNISTILYTEGEESRIHSIYNSHGLHLLDFFNEIVTGVKTTDNFKKTKQIGMRHLSVKGDAEVVVIGDSLKRDIIPANSAGFTTVYIPAGYQGNEQSALPFAQPDFQISSFHELPKALQMIGIKV